MLEYKGKYTTAKVMIDSIEQSAVQRIYSFINHEAFTNPIAIMPDVHEGKGVVIGFTMEMTDKVIPNVIGVDINCGMISVRINGELFSRYSRKEIDEKIRRTIPFGTNVHKKEVYDFTDRKFWDDVNKELLFITRRLNDRFGKDFQYKEINKEWLIDSCINRWNISFERTLKSIGSLGSGNHFIEIGKDEIRRYWITFHSGSRQLGQKIALNWQREAGKGELAFLVDNDMYGYIVDMMFAQKYAELNRETMLHLFSKELLVDIDEKVYSNHNYIDFNDFIIRKGAISSYQHKKMIIPFSMEDGILICEGKSNPEWNFSAPHGAGRLGSRKWAKETLSKEEAEKRMKDKDIYFSKLPIDETSGAYKDPEVIKKAIKPTANILHIIKPILSMKG